MGKRWPTLVSTVTASFWRRRQEKGSYAKDIHKTEESMHMTTRIGPLVIALAVALAVVAVPAVA
jgi:hypothetical protein